jgi:hypothetical protein
MHEILADANQSTPRKSEGRSMCWSWHGSNGNAIYPRFALAKISLRFGVPHRYKWCGSAGCPYPCSACWMYLQTCSTLSATNLLNIVSSSFLSVAQHTSSWDPHRDTLRKLYIDRGETLKSIMNHMRDFHGFTRKYGIWPILQILSKSLILLLLLQQRPVRATVQEMGFQQEQHSRGLEHYLP